MSTNDRPAERPETEERGLVSWLTTTDHKRIGLLYITTSLVFFAFAIGMAMLMRTQLIRPQNTVLGPETYNQVFTMHGTTMVFLFAMPMLAGLGNYLVPLMIGARDMAFPRLNALSYWLVLGGGLLLYSSFLFGGAPDTGWFSYAPLSSRIYSQHDGVDFWILSLTVLGISSMMGSVNFIVTMLRMRAPGMRLRDMPIFAFSTFLNAFLILFAIPSLTAALAMLYLDRHYGTAFYDVAQGGDPVIWQHLFWFFGHPEVYILILPAFGAMSEIVPVFSRKPLFGRGTMQIMIMFIGFWGFLVWAHHMFAVGLGSGVNAIFAGSTMIIAVPTGVKIFNWLATMWGGSLRFKTPLLFTSGFIALFTVGGLTGVSLAVVPFDWQVTDSYYVVGHFHNTLIGGTLFAVTGGIYYWYPKITGRLMSDRLGKVNFWLLLAGFLTTFTPMYVLGFLGMPRRVYTYQSGLGWDTLNLVSSLGGYIIASAVIVLIYNLLSSLVRGQRAGDDPWDAWTLEWATSSPPPWYNFATQPVVRSPRPLWDLKNPDRPDPVIPGAVAAIEGAGREEKIPARPVRSALPILAALGMVGLAAGGLGSLAIPALGAVFLFGVLIAWAAERWTGEAVRGPGRHHGATGILLFIGSEAVFFGALFYAYLHLRMRADMWPPSGMPALDARVPAINTLVLVTSGLLAHWGALGLRQGRLNRFAVGTSLAVILGAVFLTAQGYEYLHAGFGLSDGLMGSTFFTLTGFHGAHVAVGILLLSLAGFRGWRAARGEGLAPPLTEAWSRPGRTTGTSSTGCGWCSSA
ncbi:MAG: cytochrome c oxidase subunit I [Thermoleophilia bacterium]|nr:cytochrome c oxidase subunit I [Thermoleophilia bacterium]